MAEKSRTSIAGLVLSVAAVAGVAAFEGYRQQAYIPVPGDVPTIAHGTTVYPDGQPVRIGDVTTPARALDYLRHDADKFARAVKRCAPVPMYQYEFDAFVSLTYNVGEGAFCRSTIARKLTAGDYAGACAGILSWDKFKGVPLRGLTTRRQAEYKTCKGETH